VVLHAAVQHHRNQSNPFGDSSDPRTGAARGFLTAAHHRRDSVAVRLSVGPHGVPALLKPQGRTGLHEEAIGERQGLPTAGIADARQL